MIGTRFYQKPGNYGKVKRLSEAFKKSILYGVWDVAAGGRKTYSLFPFAFLRAEQGNFQADWGLLFFIPCIK